MSLNNKNEDFKDNPNLKFKKILNIQNSLICETLSIEKFDYFILNDIPYIAIPDFFCFISNSIFIFKINQYLNLERKLSLEGHKAPIVMLKNFCDNKNQNSNYLISSDKNYLIIIWKIIYENSVIIKQTLTTKYQDDIFSSIILFKPKNIFIITSYDSNSYSTEYDFNSGDFKRNIPGTKNNQTFSILNYNEFIIELCLDKIVIYNLIEENDIYEIKNDEIKGKNCHGCLIKDLLFVINNSNGKIIIIDLNLKIIQKIINTNYNNGFLNIINWNSYYLIITDIKNNALNIFEVNQMKIINSLKIQTNPLYIQKIELNNKIYNNKKFLLIIGEKMFFELWLKINN